jgi:integrase
MGKVDLEEHVADYIVSQSGGYGSEGSKRNLECILNKFLDWWEIQRDFNKVTHQAVNTFLVKLQAGYPNPLKKTRKAVPLAPNSYNHQMNLLKGFINYLIREEVAELRATEGMKHKKAGGVLHLRLSHDEVLAMLDSAQDAYERWILACAYYTFGRDSECCPLLFGHIDEMAGEITWFRKKTQQHDTLPMMDAFAAEYRRWRKALAEIMEEEPKSSWHAIPARTKHGRGGWTYNPQKGRYSCAVIVKKNVKNLLKGVYGAEAPEVQSLVKDQGVHILRRSGARNLYEEMCDAGVERPIDVVQAMLGHANVPTTLRYIGVDVQRRHRDKVVRHGDWLSNRPDTGGAAVIPIRSA